jgi:hypothetical protein
VVALKLLALGGDVHPKTAIATYRACTLDLEADDVGWIRGRGQVDVGARDVWSTSVGQWQQVDMRGGSCEFRHGVVDRGPMEQRKCKWKCDRLAYMQTMNRGEKSDAVIKMLMKLSRRMVKEERKDGAGERRAGIDCSSLAGKEGGEDCGREDQVATGAANIEG